MMSAEKMGIFEVKAKEQRPELVHPGETAFTGEAVFVDIRSWIILFGAAISKTAAILVEAGAWMLIKPREVISHLKESVPFTGKS